MRRAAGGPAGTRKATERLLTPHEGEMCRRLVYALRCELKARHRTNEQIRVAIGDSEVRARHTRLDVSSIR